MKKILSILFVLSLQLPLLATHLVGGHFIYQYVGPVGAGQIRYNVTLITYQNCNSPFWGGGFPERNLEIGVYNGSLNQGTNISLNRTFNMNLVDTTKVIANISSNCNLSLDSCVNRTTYVGFFTVPVNANGYTLFYDRCCRTPNLVNLVNSGTQGDAYTTFIPSPAVANSSPVFPDLSIPYICIGDTFTYILTGIDPDGDLLQYNFATPLFGFDVSGSPNGAPLANMSLPIPEVTFAPGFNANTPFGTTGFSNLNSTTGIARFVATQLGPYVLAVDVSEFRNGVLVGRTRRNVQINVINCPPNNPPQNQAPVNNGSIFITAEEGESFCENILYVDTDGDTIFFFATGDLLDSSIVNPPGVVTPVPPSQGTLLTDFCWNTQCGQGRAQPYTFTAIVSDNSCVPNPIGETYVVQLSPFNGPAAIKGPISPCRNQQNVRYHVDTISGASYNWAVTGGTIIGSANGSEIFVNWGNNPNGSIELITTSQFGCNASLNVNIVLQNFTANVSDLSKVCEGDSITLGGNPLLPPGFSYQWFNAQNNLISTQANPRVLMNNSTVFTIRATNSDGCEVVDSVVVPVYVSDTVDAGNDTLLCSTNSLNLNAVGGVGYSWSGNAVFSNPNIASPFVNVTTAGFLKVDVRTSLGCVFSDSIFVNIDITPTVFAGNDTSICSLDTFSLGLGQLPDSGFSYLWEGPQTFLRSDSITGKALASANGFITLSITSPEGCIGRDSFNLTTINLPIVSISNDTIICSGDSIQLLASGGISYSWSNDLLLNNENIANPIASPTTTTNFVVTVTDNNSCSNTDSVVISVFDRLLNLGPDAFLCPGDTFKLDTLPGSNFNWSPLTGVIDANTNIPSLSVLTSSQFILTLLSTNGCIETDSISIIVDNAIPTDAGFSRSLCIGDSVQIGGNPTALGNVSFNWTITGVSISNQSNPFIQPTVGTTYVVITSSDTCRGVDSVFVSVNNNPIFSRSPDTLICASDSIQLSVNEVFPIYNWGLNPSSLPFTGPLFNSKFELDTVVYVQVTDTNGCSALDSININLFPSIALDLSNDTIICPNDSVTLTVTGANSYQWSSSNSFIAAGATGSAVIVSSVVNDTIRLIATDINGCSQSDSILLGVHIAPNILINGDEFICKGDTGNLIVGGGRSYGFGHINNQFVLQNDSSIIIFPDSSGDFFIGITDENLCTLDTAFFVNVRGFGSFDVLSDTSICQGDTAILFVQNIRSPLWLPNENITNNTQPLAFLYPSARTNYLLTGLDTFGCPDTNTIEIDILTNPNIDNINDVAACKGDIVNFGPSSVNPNFTYNWSPQDMVTNANTANPSYLANSTQTFVLQVTDSNGCRSIDSLVVGLFDFQLSVNDTGFCEGDDLLIEFIYAFTTASLSTNVFPQTGVISIDTSSLLLRLKQANSYNITANSANCIINRQLTVNVLPSPTSKFEYNAIPKCEGYEASFVNESTEANSYRWLFNDTEVFGENPLFIFPYRENLNATLISENNSGCKDTFNLSENLKNLEELMEQLPNVITPNSDGKNDIFEVPFESNFSGCLELSIFNRWGNLIYASNGGRAVWDGRDFSGRETPNGVYFYVLEIGDLQLNGTVSILR